MHSSRMRTASLLFVSPSMHCSGGGVYLVGGTWSQGVYLVPGGVPGLGGTWFLRGTWSPGGYLVPGSVPGLGGVPGPGWGYLVLGGVTGPGGCTYPGTPPCEQNDRQVQKYYLAPNFAGG